MQHVFEHTKNIGCLIKTPKKKHSNNLHICGSHRYVYMQYIHIYIYIHVCVCVVCVILLFFKVHFQEAKVLSVSFPKEYNHIKLAASCSEASQVVYIFHSRACCCDFSIHPYIHPSIHACMHTCTCIDSLNLF